MVDWNDLRYFLAVHRAGTLAGAAAKLGINATTVGRRITALEEEVAVRLFDRTPDGWRVTAAGRDLLPHAERMEDEAFAVERDLRGADQRVSGTVRLATTEMLGTRFLAPHLPRFAERHPGITLELSCQQRSVSLMRGEADVVLRLSRPREDDVVAKELTSIQLALYAARSYLERAGRVDSLDGHRVLLFAASPAFSLENAWLAPRVANAEVVLRSDSVSALYAAAAAGLGVALLPSNVADKDPRMVRLETDAPPEPRRVWQGVHRDLVRTARVQRVTEFLAEVVCAL